MGGFIMLKRVQFREGSIFNMASFSSFNNWEGTISAILENIIKPGRVISEKKVIEVKIL